MTLILFVMFYSDFIVRGYEDQSLSFIPVGNVYLYQFLIFLITASIYLMSVLTTSNRNRLGFTSGHFSLSRRQLSAITFFSIAIVLIEMIKRLYFSDWSLGDALYYSFGPRFGRPWLSSGGALGDSNFLFALVGILFTLAVTMAGSLAVVERGYRRFALLIVYLVGVSILVGEGTRTTVLFSIMVPFLIYVMTRRSIVKRSVAFFLILSIIPFVSSLMISNRDYGFLNPEREIKGDLTYHQDDSYYRAIAAMYIADTSDERWEAPRFILAATLNFIPRAIWPGKPYVLDDFFGSYKESYITISFIGEFVAMFGLMAGFILSIMMGYLLYRFLYWNYKKITSTGDLILYFLAVIWVYMIMRNMLNITQWMYMYAFMWLLLYRKNLVRVLTAR